MASNNGKGSFLFALLGFLVPLVGLIIYLVLKKDNPAKAKSAGKGALVAVIVSVIGFLISAVAGVGILGASLV